MSGSAGLRPTHSPAGRGHRSRLPPGRCCGLSLRTWQRWLPHEGLRRSRRRPESPRHCARPQLHRHLDDTQEQHSSEKLEQRLRVISLQLNAQMVRPSKSRTLITPLSCFSLFACCVGALQTRSNKAHMQLPALTLCLAARSLRSDSSDAGPVMVGVASQSKTGQQW